MTASTVAPEKIRRTRARGGTTPRWGPEEEALLRELVAELGEKSAWSTIAKRLGTNRSASGVDQHWQIMMGKKKRRGGEPPPVDVSSAAGVPRLVPVAVAAPGGAAALPAAPLAAEPAACNAAPADASDSDDIINIV